MPENEKPKNSWGLLIFAVFTVVILWLLNWLFVWKFLEKSEERGNFGDMFGAINALFSGLAFAFLIYTIWIQREELKLQREELKLQREVLELQAEELKRQADELKRTAELQKETLKLQETHLKLTQEQISKEQERRIKAYFVQHGDMDVNLSHRCYLTLYLRNNGASASNVKIVADPVLLEIKFHSQPLNLNQSIAQFDQKNVVELSWEFNSIDVVPDIINIRIDYDDVDRNRQSQSLQIKENSRTENHDERFKIIYLEE